MSSIPEEFQELSDELLALVAGGDNPGYQPENNGLGRVGPGMGMAWLGDYYTPEALAHDRAVRGYKAQGAPSWQAHLRSAPLLPAAAWSYARARIHPGPNDMHIPRR